MIEIADVFRRFADDYLLAHGATILPSHRRAIADILACRTEALGGHLWRCDHCSTEVYSYHSCKNRSCPKCHTDQTQRWLGARKAEVLPCPYFHVTITVPEELRDALRANQKDGYSLLMKAAAEAIVELARDPRYVGGTVGILAVLHTWTQQLLYHPHVHCLVTGGGVSDDGQQWHPARTGFLVPFAALAKLVRGKLRAALAKRRPDLIVPEATWSKRWVVHCTAWGEGDEAVLRYLARYVFRVAITNNRIVGLDEDGVTLRHKHRASNRWRIIRLTGHEFMRRFLQHVLPKGLHKIRYYGLWNPARREQARRAARPAPTWRHDHPRRSATLPIGLATTRHALNGVSVRAASRAISSTSVVSIPSRRAGHDHQPRMSRLPPLFSAHVRGMRWPTPGQRALQTRSSTRVGWLAAQVLASAEHDPGSHRAASARFKRQSEPRHSGSQLKIP